MIRYNAEMVKTLIRENRIPLTERQKCYLRARRVFDFVAALTALIILAIPLALVAVLQKISSPHEPVFFFQIRVGKNYKAFRIVKFRTMKSSAPKNCASRDLNHSDEYISRLGGILRKTSIDELPQLWNVLKGDMSIIGPRPLIYSEREIRFLRRYYGIDQITPGITGLAQVSGRDKLDPYSKTFFDREYLKNISLRSDIGILLKSVRVVLHKCDVVEGAEGMEIEKEDTERIRELICVAETQSVPAPVQHAV